MHNGVDDVVLHDAEEMRVMVHTQKLAEVSPLDILVLVVSYHTWQSRQQIKEEGTLYVFLSDFTAFVNSVHVSGERSTEADHDLDTPYYVDEPLIHQGFV